MIPFDFADVKPSLVNVILVGLMASIFIVFSKWVFTKYPVSGITEFFNAV